MKKKNRVLILVSTASVVVALVLSYALRYYLVFRKPNVSEDALLLIYRDYSYSRALDSLKATGVIVNWSRFEKAASEEGLDKSFKPGRYLIRKDMSNLDIVRTIALNWETPFNFIYRGYAKRMSDIAWSMGKWFEADSAEFASVLYDEALRDSLGFTEETYLGMFIPNTYQLYWTASPRSVIIRMKREYDDFWTAEREKKAAEIGFSRNQVITLASIVFSETKNEGEMPIIAGVYMNRLHRGMLLQACPTVIFAYRDIEPGIKRVLNRHLKIDSPYNTYKYKGLPPGPIYSPSIAAIDAVLNYDRNDYLFFAAKPEFDGTHNFARNLTEHNRNAKAYQKAYVALQKEKKEKERQEKQKEAGK